MKKIIYSLLAIIFTFVCIAVPSYAGTTPVYDPAYNNNSGAFYANGTSITITEDDNNNTIISWNGGSQIVSSTVTVFGGGSNNTSYSNSNITMQDGTVSFIVAGGVSTSENEISTVENANITINGGTVLGSISGGGYAYAQVTNSSITMNDGTVAAIIGGGMASVTVNGVYYSVGDPDHLTESENRTENVSIVINGGTIQDSLINVASVFGGGQGYSYVGNTDLVLNNGDLSTAYLTAGGSNGYTGNANVKINGGNVNVYQSVNRGIVEKSALTLTNGIVQNLYVGGETGDSSVTGIINKSDVNLLGGTVNTLDAGKSDSIPITIDQQNYNVIKTDSVEIMNDNIPSGETQISFDFNVPVDKINLILGINQKITPIITTTPRGYEYLFEDAIRWNSSNEAVATVSNNGVITPLNEGSTTVSATLIDKTEDIQVTVSNSYYFLIALLLIFIPLLLILGVTILSSIVS